MMQILTWNIQATKGCDDRFDLNRITHHIKQLGEWDVICLQEVSRNIPDLNANDQPLLISKQFPEHEYVWGAGFSAWDRVGGRCEFGNLTLVKKGLLRTARMHSLPSPGINDLQMPRTMVEVVVGIGSRSVAVFNTHLAFHSKVERVEQIQALTQLRDQHILKSSNQDLSNSWGPYSYANHCSSVILCGDLNEDSDSDVFREELIAQQWVDCWDVCSHSSDLNHQQRSPTCGCFDRKQWPQGAHVRDYFLATQDIARKAIRVGVDVETDASDHQPVFMEIGL